ncbi:hypothetical protein ACWEH1_01250 [Micromonospora chersina]
MLLTRHPALLLLGSVTASCLALPFSIIAIFVKFRPTSSAEQPNLTDWIQAVAGASGAIFTGAAFAAAAAALLVERKRRQDDIQRLERQRAEDLARLEADQADRDVAQARLIMTTFGIEVGTERIVSMEVVNYSDRVILDTEIWLGLRDNPELPNGQRWTNTIGPVLPGQGFKITDPPATFIMNPKDGNPYTVWVEFVDARGLRWRRSHLMRPTRQFDAAYDVGS